VRSAVASRREAASGARWRDEFAHEEGVGARAGGAAAAAGRGAEPLLPRTGSKVGGDRKLGQNGFVRLVDWGNRVEPSRKESSVNRDDWSTRRGAGSRVAVLALCMAVAACAIIFFGSQDTPYEERDLAADPFVSNPGEGTEPRSSSEPSAARLPEPVLEPGRSTERSDSAPIAITRFSPEELIGGPRRCRGGPPAVTAYQRALRLDPEWRQGWLELAELYLACDRYRSATEAFTLARDLASESGDEELAERADDRLTTLKIMTGILKMDGLFDHPELDE